MSLLKVRYLGIADVRTITKKEWAGAGVVVDADVVWNAQNGFTVFLDANGRMEEVLRGEGHFSLSAKDDSGGAEVIATASDVKSEGDVIVDGDTGASTASKKAKS